MVNSLGLQNHLKCCFCVLFFMGLCLGIEKNNSDPQDSKKIAVSDSIKTSQDSLTKISSSHPELHVQRIPGDPDIKKDSINTKIVVKHHFNHREQVIVGGAIMSSLAFILAIMNNYNPK